MDDRKAEAAHYKPDYQAEFEHARDLARTALEDLANDSMVVAETLPDELYSDAAVERVQRLLHKFSAEVSPSSTAVSSRQEHSPMTINPNDLTIAREWAEDTLPVARSDRERATARVIQALPDEISANTPLGEVKGWANNMLFNDLSRDPSTLSAAGYVLWLPDEIVDGAKIRELIDQWREEAEEEMSIDPEDAEDYGVQRALRSCAHRLEAVLPTPPRKPAVIKRGATAIHDEVGEVTIMSNRPNEQGRVAIVHDSEQHADGCETLIVRPETLTAPKGEHTDD